MGRWVAFLGVILLSVGCKNFGYDSKVAVQRQLGSKPVPAVPTRLTATLPGLGTTVLDLGACSGPLELSIFAGNDPYVPLADIPVTATSWIGVANFFSTSDCAPSSQVANNTLKLNKGQNRTLYYLRIITNPVLTGTVQKSFAIQTPDLTANVSFTIRRIPTQIELLGSANPMQAGAGLCTGPFTINLRDFNGLLVGALAGLAVKLVGQQAATLFTSSTCQPFDVISENSGLAFAAGQQSRQFYMKASAPADLSLRAQNVAGVDLPKQSNALPVTVFDAVTSVLFTQVVTNLQVGICSLFTIGTRNLANVATPVHSAQGNLVVNLNMLSGSLKFRANCGSPTDITSLTIPVGSQSLQFGVIAQSTANASFAGVPTDSRIALANSGNLNSSSTAQSIDLQAPNLNNVIAGAVYGPFTLTIRDGIGNPVVPSSAFTIQLTIPGGGFACTLPDCRPGSRITAINTGSSSSFQIYTYTDPAAVGLFNYTATPNNGLSPSSVSKVISRNPFSSDPAFGTSGVFATALSGTNAASPAKAVIRVGAFPNDRLVVTGNGDSGSGSSPQLVVAKLYASVTNNGEAAGTLDNSFGTNGIATITGIGRATGEGLTEQTVSGSQKFLIATTFIATDPGDLGVVRLNADGSLDNSFGMSGVARVFLSGLQTAKAVVVSNGGNIYVLGNGPRPSGGNADLMVAAFTSSGQVLSTFGTMGVAYFDVQNGAEQAAGMLAVAGVEELILGGTTTNGSVRDMFFMRIQSQGLYNCSFGQAPPGGANNNCSSAAAWGILTVPFTVGSSTYVKSAMQGLAYLDQSDKILGVGYVGESSSSQTAGPAITQISSAGVLDSAFGNNGITTGSAQTGRRDVLFSVASSNQRSEIYAVGSSASMVTPTDSNFYFVRYKFDGTPDTSASPASTSSNTPSDRAVAYGAFTENDGKVIACGNSGTNKFTLTRRLH